MRNSPPNVMQHVARLLVLTYGLLAVTLVQAGSFVLNVVDPAGAPVTGFRWLLQEDTTYHPVPGVGGDPDILSFNFHNNTNFSAIVNAYYLYIFSAAMPIPYKRYTIRYFYIDTYIS